MKALFDISSAIPDPFDCLLICEVTDDGFSYAIKNQTDGTFTTVAVFEADKSAARENYSDSLRDLIEQIEVLKRHFKQVIIMFSFEDSVLIPFSMYSSLENEQVLKLIHGDLKENSAVMTDLVTGSGVYNAYRVPKPVVNVVKSYFPHATTVHQYSVLLQQPQPTGHQLNVVFYPKRIVLHLYKNGRTVLINAYGYKRPEDVSYTLLNACQHFEMENVPVKISGLIEKESALYKELYKYFETIELAELPASHQYAADISQQPAHYFSHLFSIDA